MGWFGPTKTELQIELAGKSTRLDLLERENTDLRATITRLEGQLKDVQDALVATTNPESYQMLKADEHIRNYDDSIDPEVKAQIAAENQILAGYRSEMEQPLFKGPEDFEEMVTKLTKGVGPPEAPPGNYADES